MPKMKITQEDYNRLQSLVSSLVDTHGIGKREAYPNMSVNKYIWEVFHATMDNAQTYNHVKHYLFLRSLSDYLDDVNIATALKSILKSRL